MNQKKKLPFLLSIILYSLLVLSTLFFIVFISLALHQDQFKLLLDIYSSRSLELSLLSQLYSPFLFIVVYIISIVMMILAKKQAYYLFYILNLFLLLVLLINPPIHFLNIGLIVLINLIIIWQFSVHKKVLLDQEKARNEE